MPAKSEIIDPTSGRKAAVVDGAEVNALAVATRPLKTFENSVRFFTNPNFGADLNIAVTLGDSASETLLYDENAGSPTEWTATAIVGGGWDFASLAQSYNIMAQ